MNLQTETSRFVDWTLLVHDGGGCGLRRRGDGGTSKTRGVAVARRALLENRGEEVRDVATGMCDGDDDEATTSQTTITIHRELDGPTTPSSPPMARSVVPALSS
jgi:hypothetical protein